MKPLSKQELDELVTRMRHALEVIIRLTRTPVDTDSELAIKLRLESIRVEAMGGLGSLKSR